MALKAGYYGLKRSLLNKVKALPGIKSIGTGLSLNSITGELEATGATISIEANPEAAATENLVKLGLGENVYAVPDVAKTYQTDDATENSIVDADYIPFFDKSAASGDGAPKKSTWTNFIAKIKAKITEYVTWEASSLLGAKNLLENKATTTTVSGITFTVNSDGTITANGTATENITDFYINTGFSLKAGKYKCNGNPAGITGFVTGLRIADSTYTVINYFFEDGLDLTINEDINNLNVDIRVGSGTTFDNVVFKPMIRLATDSEDAYVPYAMTNKELTELENNTRDRLGWGSAYTEGTELSTAHIFRPITSGKTLLLLIKHYTSATTFIFRLGVITAYTENNVVKMSAFMLVDDNTLPAITSVEQASDGRIKVTFANTVYGAIFVLQMGA